MSVELNHTIVWCRDKRRSAAFLTELLGLPAAKSFGPMLIVGLHNSVSVDFFDQPDTITPQHYAFLVSEAEFDAIFARITKRALPYWALPGKVRAGQINHVDGGRGVYFEDPDQHLLEVFTRPYGSGGLTEWCPLPRYMPTNNSP